MEKGIVLLHNELHENWFEWLTDSGLNTVGIHPAGGAVALKSLEEVIEYVQSDEGKRYLDRLRNLNFRVEFECHAGNWLLDRAHFPTHPDWFRMDETGNRTQDNNFCASNRDALTVITERAGQLCQILPSDTGKYYFWQDDVKGKTCCCPDCSRLSESDQMLRFANAVIKGIRRVQPNAKLCYIAYQNTLNVPTQTEPETGIFLEYAPMERDFKHAADDSECDLNVWHAKKMNELLSFFGHSNAAVLEYWLDNSLFSNWKKPAVKLPYNPELVRRDIAFYEQTGFEKITTFAGYLDIDYYTRFGKPPIVDYGKSFLNE